MLERTLARIWGSLLNVDEISVFDRFFEIGGHSLLAARLVDEIERDTGFAIPLPALFGDDTIAGLARVIRDGHVGIDSPLVTLNEQGALPPFVFVHGALGGGGFYSRGLAHALGSDQPVVIVHPHGHDGAPIPETIEAMAANRVQALRERWPRGPYLLGGYCNGAFVAFEIARQLIDAGEQVPVVVVIEARAPADGGGESAALYMTVDERGELQVLDPNNRGSETQLRYARAIERYRGDAYAGHVVVIRSHKLSDAGPELGWGRLAASTEVHVLPGDHVTLVTRHIRELAQVTREAIHGVLEPASDDSNARART